MIHVVVSLSWSSVFVYFLLFAQLVLTYVPLIAIRFNAAIASFARDPKFEASGEWESGDLKNWAQCGDRAQSGEGACCNCRVLNLVSTCCVFFSSLSHSCCHGVPCGNDCAHSFSVEEIRVFQACLVENPSVQVVCFENHAEWRFCLAPFVCRALLVHWRFVGAVALGWRSGARACCRFLWFSPCFHERFC